MNKIKYLCLLLIIIKCNAWVPIDSSTDPGKITAMTEYNANLGRMALILGNIAQAADVADKISKINNLQSTMSSATALCNLCTKNDTAQIQNYVNNINGNLCDQFNLAYTNLTGLYNIKIHC